MHQRHSLDFFEVSLAINGIQFDKDPFAAQFFEEELSNRPHFLRYSVRYKPEQKQLLVTVELEGNGSEMTAKDAAEEMFEVASAVLNSVDGLNVKIRNVKKL